MKKTVFFDFDGTLVDSAPDLVEAANQQRRRAGFAALPYETLRGYASQGAPGLLKQALNLDKGTDEYERVRQQFLSDYFANSTRHTVMFPGIAELLDQLEQAGYQWGVVTNKAENLSLPIFSHFGFDLRYVTAVCGDTTARAKPFPDPLLLAAERAGVDAQECIYIGDDIRDIQAGKAAQMVTIAAAYGYCEPAQVPAWQADIIVDSPLQLWSAIEQLAGR